MSLSPKELQHLAQLSGLQVESDIQPHLAKDLEQIIGFMDALRQVDTENVTPLCHPSDAQQQPLRQDEAKAFQWQSDMAEQAPAFDKGHYLVPQVIDSES